MIKVLYFASLKETLGTSAEEIQADDGIHNISALRDRLCQRGEPWETALTRPRLMVAVNQEIAGADTPVADGDEVAFFPPVTGG